MATLSLLRLSPLPPLKTLHLPYLSPRSPHLKTQIRTRPPSKISMSYGSAVPAVDRLISAAAYTLPFVNALHYGRFLFARFPALGLAIEPLLPLVALYRSVPYAAFVAFFALYLGVARNPSVGRFARFNAMQAVVLDVLLALPALAQRVLGVPTKGIGFRVLEIGYNAIFLFAAGCFVYSIVSCVLGRTPYLPVVASAADRQL